MSQPIVSTPVLLRAAPRPTVAPALVRAIGVRKLAAGVCNSMIGAGIFVLPAAVAREAGGAAPLAYVICGAVMVLVMVCFAISGSRVAVSGGPYAYVAAAFGPCAGFITGFLFCASAVMAVGGLARALALSLAAFFPANARDLAFVSLLAAMVGGLVWLNIRSVRHGAALVEMMVLLKVLPLLLFAVVGIFAIQPAAVAWSGWPAAEHFGPALLLVFWSLSGGEIALQPGEELKQPERTVPRALLLAVPAVVLLYLAIQGVAQGVLGPELGRLKDGENALAPAAGRFLGTPGVALLTVGATVSMFGFLCGDLLATPRTWFALARDGFLPARLAQVHPVHRTPHLAIMLHAALISIAAVTGTFEGLVKLSGAMILVMYLLCCAAAGRLHCRDARLAGAPFQPPGAAVVPWLAIACLVWILIQQTRAELLAAAGACLTGVLLSLLRRVQPNDRASE